MTALSQILGQTVWGTFIACRRSSKFAGLSAQFADDWMYVDRALPAFYDAVEIAFQAVDSSFWLVYAKSEVVRERLRQGFTSVTLVGVT